MIKLSPENGWIAFDSNGVRYPWYSSGVLEILDKMDLNLKYVFEYGSGFSTVWYRSRGAVVDGVESNPEWAGKMGVRLETEKKEYTERIRFHQHGYDLIAIDGIYRDECTEQALQKINRGGIIILDNWLQPSAEQGDWPKTRELLASRNLPHTVYPQESHLDWKSLIIQC